MIYKLKNLLLGFLSILCLQIVLLSCATYKPYSKGEGDTSAAKNSDPFLSVFLLSGENETKGAPSDALNLMISQVEKEGEKASLFLLGNNGAKEGLPDSSHIKQRKAAQEILSAKFGQLEDFNGKIFMTAGYNDWASGGKQGYRNVNNLEQYVEAILAERGNVFLPDNGCPGPQEVQLSEDIVAIFIDTQWWLHEWEKTGEGAPCESIDEGSFLVHMKDALRRNKDKKVIVVGNHPIYSNGPHGGYFPITTHLFPPLLGTIYAAYRKNVGNLQDLSSSKYKTLRAGLEDVFKIHPNLIYVTGHEKSLQYHNVDNQHHVISGSINDAKPVVKGKTADFAYAANGFGRLNFYQNGDVILEFWVADGSEGKMAYSKKLFNQVYRETPEEDYGDLDFSEMTASAVGDATLFKKDRKKPGLFGINYRKEWATELEVPVFDIGKEQGGLKILKRGGGMQTRSLRMENADGKQYVLRSVEKFPEAALPPILRKTFASDLVKDQISASHPYAALVIAPMADAVGVYHTNPKLVYVKDDPRFGKYREDFKNALYIYEERPAKDRRDVDSFGNSKDIVNTLEVIEKTQKNDKRYVDQQHVLRSRIFDIFLGDWDRHDDQWRWATFKDDEGREYYQPIPRDRDQAFFFGDGSVIEFASHKWGIPKYQGFHHDIRDIGGLQFNARYFDRSFLTDLTEEEWVNMANEIKAGLTDEVIENAIQILPKPLYDLNGATIISKLKSRRDKLDVYSKQLYAFLSKTVNVVGTKKRELFEVTRLNENEVHVKVSSVTKKGKIKHTLYDRVLKADETKEVRLYGLKGDDKFKISGDTRKGVKIRVIGGSGEDTIEDLMVGKGGNKVHVYDTKEGNTLIGDKLKDNTSKDPDVNYYDRKEFKYDILSPLASISFNPDDGFILGGGFSLTKHKFRKFPFGSNNRLLLDYAASTSAFNLNYTGTFTDAIGKWDYLLEVDLHRPSFIDAFYGLGNKSSSDEDLIDIDAQYYIARYAQFTLRNALAIDMDDNRQRLTFGGYYNSVSVERDDNLDEDEDDADRFITLYPDLVGRGEGSDSPLLDTRRNYVGLQLNYGIDHTDSKHVPTRGFRYNLQLLASEQLGDESNSYQQIASDVSIYASTGGTFKTTLAARIGGAANFGDFEFYQAVKVGGTTNNRGYRKFRFAGDESVYQNTELRTKLFNFRSKVLGSFGLIAFHDIARVWSDNSDEAFVDESLDDWHRGYGAGFWITPLNQLALSFEGATSEDQGDFLFFIRFGFMF
ncbi:MAG: BamA/TamA family outer membrane protein [Bacteroidota bacterium]